MDSMSPALSSAFIAEVIGFRSQGLEKYGAIAIGAKAPFAVQDVKTAYLGKPRWNSMRACGGRITKQQENF